MTDDDVMISYLPLAHYFEKSMFVCWCIAGIAIGFYGGNQAKLMEDVQELKPTFFPSMPKLFERIHDKILKSVKEKGSTTQSMFKKAIDAKIYALNKFGVYNHKLWDNMFFNQIKLTLGGRVKTMVIGSGHISQEILNVLRVSFSCPILEGYGLTETGSAVCLTSPIDPVGCTVGGPLSCIRLRLKEIPEITSFSNVEYLSGEI